MAEQDFTRPTIIDASGNQLPDSSQKNYMYVTYALYASALFVGLTLLVGVILAYVKRDEMQGTLYYDHMRFLIKTFWGTLVGGIVGMILSVVGIGLVILALVYVWYIFRMVVGIVKLIDNKSVTPDGWFM